MKVSINGDVKEIETAEKLAAVLPANDTPFAVALNGEFIARSDYSNISLKDGDEIDIVSPVGGG